MRLAAAAAAGAGAAGARQAVAAADAHAGDLCWAARRMRAWRVHTYGGALQLDTARVPALRAPDELLVRVHTASLNPIDVAMIGGYGRRVLNTLRALESVGAGAGGVEFPLTAGRDFVGTVERAGGGARARRGQLVWGVVPPHWPGSHAQYVVVKDRWTGPAPESLGASAGGALYAGLTATSALRAAGVAGEDARGRRVLLLGLGGVGQAALQLLAATGAQVVVGCAGEMCERAEQLGAARALDRHGTDYEQLLVDCGPYDAIVDCAGEGGAAAGARRWQFKRYVTITSPLLRETDQRGLPLGLATSALALVRQCAAVAAATGAAGTSCLPPHVRWAYFMPNEADIDMLRRRAENGQWRVCVERVYAWWEGAAAYERQAGGHARGKILLDFTASAPVSPLSPISHTHTPTHSAPR